MSHLIKLILLIFSLISVDAFSQKKYPVQFVAPGKDTIENFEALSLKNIFDSRMDAENYINTLPKNLLTKGYVAASVDSVLLDSLSGKIVLFTGPKYQWTHINTDSVEPNVLQQAGWMNIKQQKGVDPVRLSFLKEQILNHYENTGYPFAEVSLQNVTITGDELWGKLVVNKGTLYHIDSIRVFGNIKIKNKFLQHYLGIYNGEVYNLRKLNQINKLIKELSFIEESQSWDVTMLGSGAVLNLYLAPKKSSQVNVLVGFLPGNNITGKTQLTADVHLDLQNSLGAGENILLTWQQLQPQSPQLKLGYSHPFIFNSKFGIDLSFDLLKRDSAFLQLNAVAGIQYLVSANQWLKVFYQNEKSYLLNGGVDTLQVIATKQLPQNIDVSSASLGIGYYFINTDYRFNPRRGNEISITAAAGIRKVTTNNDIINLKDPQNPAFDFRSLYDDVDPESYRFKITGTAARYFSLGQNSVLKGALNGGVLQSPQTFQNELFRIGGYDLLRGFDEESIYADRYAVFTAEYRYLLGINSYFFGFSDLGLTHTSFNKIAYSNTFISGGLGLEFETKFGLLNLSYAIGKRNDVDFNLRNSSKIHFGYINYF